MPIISHLIVDKAYSNSVILISLAKDLTLNVHMWYLLFLGGYKSTTPAVTNRSGGGFSVIFVNLFFNFPFLEVLTSLSGLWKGFCRCYSSESSGDIAAVCMGVSLILRK